MKIEEVLKCYMSNSTLNSAVLAAAVTLLELPDVPLIRVLYFIDLEDLLLVVNRVCKRLNDIIKYSTVLWTVFEFYDPLNITESDLPCILTIKFFYPAISTFAVQICYTNKFLSYNINIVSNEIGKNEE
jgi:hypothetical protein